MNTTQTFSLGYLAEDSSHGQIVVGIIFAVLEILFFGLFLFSHIKSKQLFEPATYFMVPGFLCCFTHVVSCFCSVIYGGEGHHIENISPQEMSAWWKYYVLELFIYSPAIAFPKLCILSLYLRIFTSKVDRYLSYSLVAIILLNWIIFWILLFQMCTPFNYIYIKTIPGGTCHSNEIDVYTWFSLPNILIDVAMLLLPLPTIWHLQTSTNQKVGLTITFLTFSMGLGTGIARFAQYLHLNKADDDVTWEGVTLMTWTTIEAGGYFIAACLPSLRFLLNPLIRKIETAISKHGKSHGTARPLPRGNIRMSSRGPKTEYSGFQKSGHSKDSDSSHAEEPQNASHKPSNESIERLVSGERIEYRLEEGNLIRR